MSTGADDTEAGVNDVLALTRMTACAVQHDYAVGPTHAICNRCEKVVRVAPWSPRG